MECISCCAERSSAWPLLAKSHVLPRWTTISGSVSGWVSVLALYEGYPHGFRADDFRNAPGFPAGPLQVGLVLCRKGMAERCPIQVDGYLLCLSSSIDSALPHYATVGEAAGR